MTVKWSDLAVLELRNKVFYLLERAPGVSVDEIKRLTEAELVVEGDVPEMRV